MLEIDILRMNILNNNLLRKIFRKKKVGVFWGYLRSMPYHKKMLSKIFEVKEYGNMTNGLNYSYFLCEKKE